MNRTHGHTGQKSTLPGQDIIISQPAGNRNGAGRRLEQPIMGRVLVMQPAGLMTTFMLHLSRPRRAVIIICIWAELHERS